MFGSDQGSFMIREASSEVLRHELGLGDGGV